MGGTRGRHVPLCTRVQKLQLGTEAAQSSLQAEEPSQKQGYSDTGCRAHARKSHERPRTSEGYFKDRQLERQGE